MNENPFFSVIVSTYNRPQLVGRALNSILKQDYKNYEIILINDGSTIPYDQVLEKYNAYCIYLKNDSSLGVSAARNKGIAAANGSWLVFLDDDDEFKPDYFAQLSQYISTGHSDVNFVWCNVQTVNYDKVKPVSTSIQKFDGESDKKIYDESATIGASYGFSVKKNAIQLVHGFNESFKIGEDTELIIRLLASGAKPGIVPTIGVVKHQHNNRLTQNFNIYSEQGIYESIIALHLSFLLDNPDIFLTMICWSAKVHYQARQMHLVNKNIIYLKKMLWRRPVKVISLYFFIKKLKSHATSLTQTQSGDRKALL